MVMVKVSHAVFNDWHMTGSSRQKQAVDDSRSKFVNTRKPMWPNSVASYSADWLGANDSP